MKEYRMRVEDGETVQCDSCNFPAPTAEYKWGPSAEGKARPMRMLCEFCATTLASRHTESTSYGGDLAILRAEIWRAAACVYNMAQAKNDGREL